MPRYPVEKSQGVHSMQYSMHILLTSQLNLPLWPLHCRLALVLLTVTFVIIGVTMPSDPASACNRSHGLTRCDTTTTSATIPPAGLARSTGP